MKKTSRQISKHHFGTLIAVLLCAPLLPGCAFYRSGVSGYVYEWVDPSKQPTQDNLKPVADAYVVAKWSGTVPTPVAHATSNCLHVALARTDSTGRYEIPGWFRFPKFYPVFVNKPSINEYKPGYVNKEWLSSMQFNLVPSTQTPDERIESLYRTASYYCEEIGDDLHRTLLPLYKALLEEAQSLKGVSPTQRYVIDGLRNRIADGQAGQE